MVLLSLAASFAEAQAADTVFYGAQAQDEYGYWDCTREFIETINRTLALNRRQPVRVEAPFASWRKSEIVRLGMTLDVDFAHTWSCYRGESRPCGVCPTCVERATAFSEAGVNDPLLPA
jgi:7-cyano-7-deazaguanine synthase